MAIAILRSKPIVGMSSRWPRRVGMAFIARPSHEQRQRRRALRVREQLVRARTQLINLVRAQLRQEGYRVPRCTSEAMPRRYATLALPEMMRTALAPALTTITTLTEQIVAADTALMVVAAADPVVQRLMTAPGVGVITGLTYRALLDDVHALPMPVGSPPISGWCVTGARRSGGAAGCFGR
jgi:transposase